VQNFSTEVSDGAGPQKDIQRLRPAWAARQLHYGRSTTFTVSLERITDTPAAAIHKFCTTNRYRAHAQATHNSYKAAGSRGRLAVMQPEYRTAATDNPLKKLNS
jgi:hypothetical protein